MSLGYADSATGSPVRVADLDGPTSATLELGFGAAGKSPAWLRNGGFTFRQLDAWQQSMKLAEDCYRITALFPKSEMYGLTSQIRRLRYPSVQTSRRDTQAVTNAYMKSRKHRAWVTRELSTLIELSTRLGLLQNTSVMN